MSTRAYKIIEIVKEKEATFNCNHDNWVLDLIYNQDQYNGDNGILEFERSQIEEALKDKKYKNKEHQDILKAIIADMDSLGDDYVMYYCY